MYDTSIRWRCFPLHPDTPQEGQLLQDLFNTTPEKIQVMVAQLQNTAKDLGLSFGARTRTFNSRLAQELGLWAEDQGIGEVFHMRAFLAYFKDGLNLAERSVLLELAEHCGLDKAEANLIIEKRSYRTRVDQDWADSREMGIRAVPTFVMGDHKIVGAQPFEILEQLLRINKVSKRK